MERITVFKKKYFLIFVDFLIIELVFLNYLNNLGFGLKAENFNNIYYYLWGGSLFLVWSFYAFIFNLQGNQILSDTYLVLRNTILSSLLTTVTYLFLPILTPAFPHDRLDAYIFVLSFTFSICLWRVTYSYFFSNPIFHKRLLILGGGYSGNTLINVFNQDNFKVLNDHFKIIGVLDDDKKKINKLIHNTKVIGDSSMLLRFARLLKINEVIIAISDKTALNKNIFPQLIECGKMNISISYMDNFYERITGMIPINHVGDKYYLRFPLSDIHTQRLYILLTRVLDLIFGFLGVLLLLIFVPIIAFLNFFLSKGPLFYKQTRVGKDGKEFEIVKFRSMVTNAEAKSGAVWAQKNDPRITPLGRFLRKTRVDELPQFLNVLKGEMSIIGPRPERPFFVDELKKEIPFYDLRHLVKPGITGWAQVMYKYTSDKEDTIIKLQYDLYYIKNRTLLLDLKILLTTIRVVLGFKGT